MELNMKTLGLTFAVVATLLTAAASYAQAATSVSSAYQYSHSEPGNGSPNKVDGGR
jgi:hypothetical protein